MMISMTSREGASLMFADLDRDISPESPDLAKLIELGQRYGLAVAVPDPTARGHHAQHLSTGCQRRRRGRAPPQAQFRRCHLTLGVPAHQCAPAG